MQVLPVFSRFYSISYFLLSSCDITADFVVTIDRNLPHNRYISTVVSKA